MRSDDLDVMETVGLLRQVATQIVTSTDLDQALGRLADLAGEVAPGLAWCGIAVLRDGDPRLAARSGAFRLSWRGAVPAWGGAGSDRDGRG
jgi:hypothetical protein